MLFATQYNSKSQIQCTGDEVFTSYTFTYESCSYTVDFCVSCSVTAPGSIRFAGLHYDLEQTGCMDNDYQIQTLLSGEIHNPNFIFNLMEPCLTQAGAPPCDEQVAPYEFNIIWAYCWRQIDKIVITNNGPQRRRYFYACEDDVNCSETITVCYDEILEEFRIIRSSPTIVGSGTPSCTKMHFEITPMPINVYTECFRIISNPCPWPTE